MIALGSQSSRVFDLEKQVQSLQRLALKSNPVTGRAHWPAGAGFANDPIAHGDFGSIEVYKGALDDLVDTGYDLECYNPGPDIDSGDEVRFNFTNGFPEAWRVCGGSPVTELTGDVTGTGTSSIATTISNDAVTYAKMQNISATNRFLGRITAGAGDPEELTGTQATSLLDVFTTSLKGLVPPSGGGTVNFLRADGSFVYASTTTAGNPTATVGPTATNGVSTSFMRADGAPAIDLTANYTWAGTHTFPNSGIKIKDGSGSNPLTITTSTYSHPTTLTLTTVPAVGGGGTTYDFTLTIKNNIALDQDLLFNSNVRFGTANIAGICIMGAFSLGGASQIVSITADTNDLALTADASIVVLLPDNDWTITGISGGATNQVWYELYNASNTHTITLSHENASSSVFHRFHFASGSDYILPPRASVLIYYPDSHWRQVVDVSASGSVTSVGLSMPVGFSVASSPITTTGTLAVTTSLNGVVWADGSGFSASAIPSNAAKFFNGAATPVYAFVTDADLSLSDITTNNVSTSMHGFAPKGDGDTSKFLSAAGTYLVPTGSGITFSNPTGLIGMSAVNGVSAAATRSDATHAIDPAITPHWTAGHQFDVFRLTDVGAAHYGTIALGSTYTSNRIFTLTTGDASRAMTLVGDPTLGDWFDQSVKTTSGVTFGNITDSALTASKPVFTNGSKLLVSTGTLNWDQGGTGYAAGYVDGEVLIGDTASGGLIRNLLSAGSGISISVAGGSITITNTGTTGSGGGVSNVSGVNTHGFSFSIANPSSTPAITLSCTVNAPVLACNGTTIAAATTTGSGSIVVLNNNPTVAGSLTLSGTSPTLLMTDASASHTLNISCTATLSSNRSFAFNFNNDCTLSLGGNFSTTGSLDISSVTQGVVPYGSAAGVLSMLAKDTNATRYLGNTGTSNNIAWTQINLSNGVSNILSVGNGGTGVGNSYVDGDLLIGSSVGNTLVRSQLIAGTNVGISVGHGTITISSTGTGGGGGTVTHVGIIPPAEGITVIGSPVTGFGDMTLGLADDLAGLESLSSFGIAVRTGTSSWNLVTLGGTSDRITCNNSDGVSGGPVFDISASYVGQTSLTTLGTITTGTWHGATVTYGFGGTSFVSYSAGDLLIGKSDGSLAKHGLTAGSGIIITPGDGTITVATSGSSGSGGDFSTNTSTSVVNEIVLFADTGAKLGKRSTGTGVATLTSGVLGTATIGSNLSYSSGTLNLAAAVTIATSITVPNIGLLLLDTNATNTLNITWNENDTSNRTLSVSLNAANRVFSLSGNLTVTATATVSGTNTGDQTITLTGDVTGTGTGSFAATISANAVTDAKLRQSAGLSVIGRSTNTTGNVADITAGSDGNILRRSGTTLGFGAIDLSSANAVTNLLSLGNGGTGANLSDPNADRILFWDDSAGQVTWLTAGTGLTITGTTMTASGSGLGGNTGDVQGALLMAGDTSGNYVTGHDAGSGFSSVLTYISGVLKNYGNTGGINVGGTQLQNNSSQATCDWNAEVLTHAGSGVNTFDWGQVVIKDLSNVTSFDGNNRYLRGPSGFVELQWGDQKINVSRLPTSASGLASGDLWVDAGAGNVLKRA